MATLRILPGELNLVFWKLDAARIKLTFPETIAGLTWDGVVLDRSGNPLFTPTITTEGTTILYLEISKAQMLTLAASAGATWYLQETTADRTYFAGSASVLEKL
jgi:hypothetical protein